MDKRHLFQLVSSISYAAEIRDFYTSKHQSGVSSLSRRIAQALNLTNDRIEAVRIAGTLHDIGKLAIPVALLSKVGKLRKEEFELIKIHSIVSEEIIKDIKFPYPIATIVRQHHERLDGSGYPDGLKANNILMESKIVAVADVVESMMQSRAYRKALGVEVALDEIKKNKNILYDADVVAACLNIFSKYPIDECFSSNK